MLKLSKYFSDYEVRCHGPEQGTCNCGGSSPVDRRLLELLDKFRERIGKPVYLSCAFRCLTHNKACGSGDTSQHPRGCAADISRIAGLDIDEMARIALYVGFDGVGYYDWGIHVDVRNEGGKPDIVFDKRRNAR